MDGASIAVAIGGLLLGGGGAAAIIQARAQGRSIPRRDAVEERRLDLDQSESTNRILAETLRFFKERSEILQAQLDECNDERYGNRRSARVQS